MPRFRTKIHEVEAIQLRHPVTVPFSGSTPSEGGSEQARTYDVPAGTWLVMDGEGSQSYVPDDQFTSVYEAVPMPPRRGRPPKGGMGEGSVASLPRKRRHRKRHKQQGVKAA